MDLLSRIRPEETAIHAILETTAMTAGETPRIENLCESSSSCVVVVALLLGRRCWDSFLSSLGDRDIVLLSKKFW